MGIQFAWFYDVAVVALILIFIYIGGKRGFIRSILMIAGYFISFVLAFFVSKTASPIIYENYIQQKVVSIVEENIQNINVTSEVKKALGLDEMGITIDDQEINNAIANSNGDVSEGIHSYILEKTGGYDFPKEEINSKLSEIFNNDIVNKFISSLPGFMTDSVNEYRAESNDVLSEALKAFTSTKAETAQFIEKNIIRSSVLSIVKLLVFIVVFIVALFIVRFITGLFSVVNKIPVAGSINALMGSLFGLIQGIIIILIISVIIHVFVTLSGDKMIVFNSETIQNTNLFKLFYNFKILK